MPSQVDITKLGPGSAQGTPGYTAPGMMNYGYGPGTYTGYMTGGKTEEGLNWPAPEGFNRLPGTVNGWYRARRP